MNSPVGVASAAGMGLGAVSVAALAHVFGHPLIMGCILGSVSIGVSLYRLQKTPTD